MMIRAKYTKKGDLVYLSHLDLVRLFERAFRRANIPLAFTQGFNPHPIINFAAPLSVGVSSEAEYFDVVLAEPITPEHFTITLNKTLPSDIQILQAIQLDEKPVNALMQEAALMVYSVSFSLEHPLKNEALTKAIDQLTNQNEVIIQKKGKDGSGKSNKRFGKRKKMKQVDILPYIHTFTLKKLEDNFVELLLEIKVFDQATIKPLHIFNKWIEMAELSVVPDSVFIERKEIFKIDEEQHYISILQST